VDWSWPTRGAAFLDPAQLVEQLVAAGHGPAAAEAWLAPGPAWATAAPGAVDAYVAASLRTWRERAARWPDEAWLGAMVRAVGRWAAHRGVVVA
jgi:hypothetical protein